MLVVLCCVVGEFVVSFIGLMCIFVNQVVLVMCNVWLFIEVDVKGCELEVVNEIVCV